ncbi:hypothetical protein SODG_007122 [Sodalis praecaptivus]
MVFKGLETVRSDWTPLAQQFQQQLYERIFRRQPYQTFVRDYVRQTLDGSFDDWLIYRKRLRRKLGNMSVTSRPRRARRASPMPITNASSARSSTRTAAGTATS